MAKINYVDGSAPNNPLDSPMTAPGYNFKRGKVLPKPRAAWDMVDANGRTVDHEQARALLDEALGD